MRESNIRLLGGILFSLFLAASLARAESGFSFLEIPVGAREGAMGGAGAALSSGPTSAAHNPASLAFNEHSGIVAMTNRQYGDTRSEFFAVSLKSNKWTFAPHYWGTRISDIEYREGPTRDPISTFDALNSAVGVAGAYRINDRVSAGATLRYLYSKILYESSDGWAVDAGTLWRTPLEGLSLAAAVNHLGHVNPYIEEAVTLPTTLTGAAAYEYPVGPAGSVLVTAEAQGVRENTPIFRSGVEYRAPKVLALRAGYVSGLAAQGVSLGFGLAFKMVRLDYAYIPYREDLGEGHRFSLGIDL